MADNKKQESRIIVALESIEYFVDRYPKSVLSAILLLGLILRVLALLSLKETLYFDFLLWDERVYHQFAIRIMNGTYESALYLFTAIIALIYKLFSPNILYIRILNIASDVLTCYFIYLIGKEMFDRKTGVFACLIAALYKPFILYSIVPLNTALSLLLFALTIYFLTTLVNKNSIIKALILGVAVGLLYNVRPNFIFLLPLIPLFIIWDNYREKSSLKILVATLLIYILGLSLSQAPFATNRYRVRANSIATTSQIGLNLYLGNNLNNPDPYYRPVPFAASSPLLQTRHFNMEASRRVGKRLSTGESSQYWTNEVFRMALERPGDFVWKLFQKSLVLFNRFEAGDHYHIGFLNQFAEFFKIPLFNFWIILPFGVAGMAVNIGRSRKLLFISSTVFLYGLTLIVFFTNARYRLPVMVVLIPFAVMGVRSFIFYIRSKDRKRIVIYSSVVAVFFIMEFLPVKGTDDMTAYYNTHAIILNVNGFEEEAIKYWEESSRMDKPFSAFANLYLAEKYYGKGDTTKAKQYLDKIPGESFAASSKYQIMGDILFREGKAEEAVEAYEKSLEINSASRASREKLIKLLWRIDRERAFMEYDELESMNSAGS